jgi:hypothetical protein
MAIVMKNGVKTETNPFFQEKNPFTSSAYQYVYNAADPFHSERGNYATQLRNLMKNPASVADNGAYKWAFDQGNEALNRTLAATGNRGSGRAYSEAIDYGQGKASQQFFQLADLLAGLSGGKQQPGVGGGAMIDFFNSMTNDNKASRQTVRAPRPLSNTASFGGGYGSGSWA